MTDRDEPRCCMNNDTGCFDAECNCICPGCPVCKPPAPQEATPRTCTHPAAHRAADPVSPPEDVAALLANAHRFRCRCRHELSEDQKSVLPVVDDGCKEFRAAAARLRTQPPLPPAVEKLVEAATESVSDCDWCRPCPDCRNSIKAAISAVRSARSDLVREEYVAHVGGEPFMPKERLERRKA